MCQPRSETEPTHPALKRRNSLKAGKAVGVNLKKSNLGLQRLKRQRERQKKLGWMKQDTVPVSAWGCSGACQPAAGSKLHRGYLGTFQRKMISQRNGNFLTTKMQTLSFCFCKNKVKMIFCKEIFFLFKGEEFGLC